MCELLAMSARHPATVSFSREGFSRRGGLSGPRQDGWGIAAREGRDFRVIRELRPRGIADFFALTAGEIVRRAPARKGVPAERRERGPRGEGREGIDAR